MGEGAQTRKSSNYMMSSKMDAHSQMQSSIYDDTGRSHQTMKVNRLLDRAKKVIANDTKKVEKEAFRMEQKLAKTKTTLQGAGMSIMGSANNTTTSMISVKDRALAKFEMCRSA